MHLAAMGRRRAESVLDLSKEHALAVDETVGHMAR
jgi:hypothetical protein